MNEQVMPLQALPRKKSGQRAVFPMLAGMALGALCGWPIGLLMKAHGRFHLSPWIIPMLPVVLLLGLAWHEAGHVTAWLIGGFEFRLFVAGPLRVERHDGRFKISFMSSAALGIVTLLPLPAGGFKTDGMRLAMLLRRRPEGKRWTALAALGGLAQTARPREWPAELMAHFWAMAWMRKPMPPWRACFGTSGTPTSANGNLPRCGWNVR
jgi:hypothetical protein